MSRRKRDRDRSTARRAPGGAAAAAPLACRPPSFTDATPLPLVELVPPPEVEARFITPGVNSYLRTYRLGYCSVLVTREFDDWHLSIAHESRLPTWREVCEARYRLVPDGVTMAMLLPPKDDYINIHEHCLQCIQIATQEPPHVPERE